LKPKIKGEKNEEGEVSSETEEEFNWYNPQEHDKESTFCFVNL